MRGENPTGIYRYAERVVKSFLAVSFLVDREKNKPFGMAHEAIELKAIDSSITITSKFDMSDIQCLRKQIDPKATRYEGKPKLKYLLPLDDKIAERIKSLSKAYPQTCATSDTSDTPGVHPGKGRAARTVALHF